MDCLLLRKTVTNRRLSVTDQDIDAICDIDLYVKWLHVHNGQISGQILHTVGDYVKRNSVGYFDLFRRSKKKITKPFLQPFYQIIAHISTFNQKRRHVITKYESHGIKYTLSAQRNIIKLTLRKYIYPTQLKILNLSEMRTTFGFMQMICSFYYSGSVLISVQYNFFFLSFKTIVSLCYDRRQ